MPETREEFEKGKKEVEEYRPPAPHRVTFRRRVFQIEGWVHRSGIVEKEDVVLYIQRAFDIERKAALEIYKAVEEDFRRIGKVYGN